MTIHDLKILAHRTAKAMEELERQKTEAFYRWVTPSNVSHLRESSFSRWRHMGRRTLLRLDEELRDLGITRFMQNK